MRREVKNDRSRPYPRTGRKRRRRVRQLSTGEVRAEGRAGRRRRRKRRQRHPRGRSQPEHAGPLPAKAAVSRGDTAGTAAAGRSTAPAGRTWSSACRRAPSFGVCRETGEGEVVADLTDEKQSVVVAKGGRGGRGNVHFATSTNRAPHIAEKGEPGEEADLQLDLKLLSRTSASSACRTPASRRCCERSRLRGRRWRSTRSQRWSRCWALSSAGT